MLRRCIRLVYQKTKANYTSVPSATVTATSESKPFHEGLTRYPAASMPGVVRGLDYMGTVCFAMSGSLTAAAADMDLWGCVVVGSITALGGGTIRDILNAKRVFWLEETEYFTLAVFAAAFTFFGCYYLFGGDLSAWPLNDNHPLMFWGDTFGIGAFCVIGTMSGIRGGYNTLICLFHAVITSTGGGMVRDTLCKRPVRVLHSYSEIYATTALSGSAVYLLMRKLAPGPSTLPLRIICGMSTAILLRVYASTYGTKLPTLTQGNKSK